MLAMAPDILPLLDLLSNPLSSSRINCTLNLSRNR
jgi:hypothetical protein